MVKLYANENFPLPAVIALRGYGYDVLTTREANQAGQAISDEAVLAFAIEQERAILTFNRKHFIRLHHTHPNHVVMIVCTFDANFEDLALRIHQSIQFIPNLFGQLIRVNRPSV